MEESIIEFILITLRKFSVFSKFDELFIAFN